MRVETVSYRRAIAVTPSDSAILLNGVTKGLYIGGGGNIVATMSDGVDVTLTGLLTGTVYPLSVKQVKATNTTATNIIALY